MSVEIKICIDGPEDEKMDQQEDAAEKTAKITALRKLLKGTKFSDDSLASFIELLASGKED